VEHDEAAKIAGVGVTRTSLAVEEDLGWLFREHPTRDYGIDDHIEVVDGTHVSGRLLALQIKSGPSYFSRPTPGGWWYYPDNDHVDYWLKHSLPVVVVLYEPESKACYWQLVNSSTLEETSGTGFKLIVPASQILNSSASAALRAASEGDPYVLRLRELRLALPWMKLLVSGKRLVVDIEEWVNKTSGRGSIALGIDEEDGEKPHHLANWSVMLGRASYAEVVPQLFAWADVTVHEETYEAAEQDEWRSFDVIETHEDWVETRGASGLRPYANCAGEVDDWRLELTLGALGEAFLVVDTFASTDSKLLTK
jgi:hypothetical protein